MRKEIKMKEVTMNELKEIVEKMEENTLVTVWIGGEKNEQ
jgi:exonuclease VII small subunit